MIQIVPWLFALDHINYARWLPVHIVDMLNLIKTHPGVYHEFMSGHFAVQKTNKVFSAISIDQCHEQMNKLIKGEGGAVGLTEDPQALERWMVAGPEISRLILEFETSFQAPKPEKSNLHHEQNLNTQNKFAKDVNALVETFEELGNPFLEDNGDLVTLDTKKIMSKEVIQTVNTIEENGKKQYNKFVSERLHATQNIPLSDTISKNNYPLFSKKSRKQQSRIKQQVKSLEMSNKLFLGLYIGCQVRGGDTKLFFERENQHFPPSLSDLGQQRQGTKSDLLVCFEQCAPSSRERIQVDAMVFDGAVTVHMLKPVGCRIFKDYIEKIYHPYIKLELNKVERLDVVWDRYFPNSLKQSAREKRGIHGTTQKQRVLDTTPISSNWEGFLQIEVNKDNVFHFISKSMENFDTEGKVLVSTYDERVITAGQKTIKDMESMQPCSHEEADTRILLHVANCAKQGYKRIAIRTVDTDVVVLAVAHFQYLDIEELWINFGVGKHHRMIPAHAISNFLNEKAIALMMFHALTGCDTVSSFRGRGKKTAWAAWMAYPAVTDAFISLLLQPGEITSESEVLHNIERFVILIYSKVCTLSRVNDARKELFAVSRRSMDNIPPTQGALIQHIKRAVYQASYLWAQALKPSPDVPSPKDWGYNLTPCGWTPHWTNLADASEACQEIIRCGCTKGCKTQCKCRSANLECTELCKCNGECDYE